MADDRSTCAHCGAAIDRRPGKAWVHTQSMNKRCVRGGSTFATPKND
jgi:hypothetical protein